MYLFLNGHLIVLIVRFPWNKCLLNSYLVFEAISYFIFLIQIHLFVYVFNEFYETLLFFEFQQFHLFLLKIISLIQLCKCISFEKVKKFLKLQNAENILSLPQNLLLIFFIFQDFEYFKLKLLLSLYFSECLNRSMLLT